MPQKIFGLIFFGQRIFGSFVINPAHRRLVASVMGHLIFPIGVGEPVCTCRQAEKHADDRLAHVFLQGDARQS